MYFALLLEKLPHVQESRAYYDTLLSLGAGTPDKMSAFSALWAGIKSRFS
jgi:hypothetical protein